MTDTPTSTVLLAATHFKLTEKFGDDVLIVTPRTRNRLRGYRADRVLHTPRALLQVEYAAMNAEAQICLATRHLTVVKP